MEDLPTRIGVFILCDCGGWLLCIVLCASYCEDIGSLLVGSVIAPSQPPPLYMYILGDNPWPAELLDVTNPNPNPNPNANPGLKSTQGRSVRLGKEPVNVIDL